MKNWFKTGTPWIWLNAGAVTLSVVMVVGLIALIAVRGLSHFWPADVVQIEYQAETDVEPRTVIGHIRTTETLTAKTMREAGYRVPMQQDLVTRHLIKRGNRDVTGRDFVWYLDSFILEQRYPEEIVVLERREWGDFYGYLQSVRDEGDVVAEGDGAWPALEQRVHETSELVERLESLERYDIGLINQRMEALRLDRRAVENNDSLSEEERQARFTEIEAEMAELDAEYAELREERQQLQAEAATSSAVFRTMDGTEVTVPLENIVRATRPNAMGLGAKLAEYGSRFWDFLSGYPREANTEGGILPAIFGTVVMVIIMSIFVTPFGVLAAVYLREYAKQGTLTRIIRISVNNLAGVPSIVFGVFGLGFFVYLIGGSIDEIFYKEALPSPTFGSPGLIWASLTLALLTLPVVIVSTEEGLSRIPRSVREGSLALGATKAETLWRTVMPLASPAMMTGLILAVARAAGEVAPLMLVGVVKLAPNLPIDGQAPFVHLERSIMHLGFHIYDVGFQSPNVEAARPLVYATSLVLIMIIIILNLTAIAIRNRLREKYKSETD